MLPERSLEWDRFERVGISALCIRAHMCVLWHNRVPCVSHHDVRSILLCAASGNRPLHDVQFGDVFSPPSSGIPTCTLTLRQHISGNSCTS